MNQKQVYILILLQMNFLAMEQKYSTDELGFSKFLYYLMNYFRKLYEALKLVHQLIIIYS